MKYGISFNPKKSIFGMEKGKLLGNIVSKDGISFDPSWIEYIKNIPPSKEKRVLQSFYNKINFIKIFILNFTEIAKRMKNMLKKDTLFQ